MLVVPMRVIPATAGQNFFRCQAEEEEIFLTRLLGHLDGSAVASADGQGAVHHELHVARAAGLVASRRDLLRHIAGGNQPLCEADVILGEEEHFEAATNLRVSIDDGSYVVDQLDDEFGQVVCWRRFAGEEKGARWYLQMRVIAQLVVEYDDVQDVQELALVLVDALDLAVKDRI